MRRMIENQEMLAWPSSKASSQRTFRVGDRLCSEEQKKCEPYSPNCRERLFENSRLSLKPRVTNQQVGQMNPICWFFVTKIPRPRSSPAIFQTVSEGAFSEVRLQNLA